MKIDTGVDYTHDAFGSCYGGPDCKIQYGFDFVEPYRPGFQGGFDCVGVRSISFLQKVLSLFLIMIANTSYVTFFDTW
jgi:hypothetical protein